MELQLPGIAGKTVLVTGAGRGVGAGVARRFAAAGARVVIGYHRSADAAERLMETLMAQGAAAKTLHIDQTDTAAIPAALEQAADCFGGLDFLVNNAGIYPSCPVMDIDEAAWDHMLDSNTRSVFFLCREAAKRLPAGGAIVNISSINATNPADRMVHYCVSKAAVETMTRCLAHDFGKYGVRVNCVAPGLVDAPQLDQNVPGWRESYQARAPLGRLPKAEDIGDACLFFCSQLAGAVTGQVLTVDCGVLLAPAFDNSTGN